jgi:hypothetical protein
VGVVTGVPEMVPPAVVIVAERRLSAANNAITTSIFLIGIFS